MQGSGLMGKGGTTGGLTDTVTQDLQQNQSALVNIAQQQNTNAQQLYQLTEPGLNTAESFYSTLASGDPQAIMRAISPATQQIDAGAAGAKANIIQNTPAGGEKNLALENVIAGQGSQIGSTGASAYLNAPNALAGLAGQGIGESLSASGQGLSGYSNAAQAENSLGGLQIQSEQVAAQEKGSSMGLLGSLAGSGAELGAAGKGGGAAAGGAAAKGGGSAAADAASTLLFV